MDHNLMYLLYLVLLLPISACVNKANKHVITDASTSDIIPYDDTRPGQWPEPFERVEIPSSLDSQNQSAWFYAPEDTRPRPLLISLHTWSADYNQKDTLAMMALEEDWNYIHPDFRGPNWTPKACCSEFAMEDIDQAIDFAIMHGNVDTSRIYVNGVSGGGYAALAVYMRSRHSIHTISAWVPISDLYAWYGQSLVRGKSYAENIVDCTGSEGGKLDKRKADKRSPLFWKTPLRDTRLHIYAGVYDGIQGSVPITQSINFYNKLVKDLGSNDLSGRDSAEIQGVDLVHPEEIVFLLEYRKPMKNEGLIGDRKICLQKQFENISLVIFEGAHEMLPEVAFRVLKND